eukprot:scaffold4.g4668.t1
MDAPRLAREQVAGGLVPALTLLLVAYANQSLAGFIYLLAFGAWGAYIVPNADRPRSGAISRALWTAISGLSAVLLLLELGVQAAFAAHAPGILRPSVTRTLSLLGFSQAGSPAALLLGVLPLLAALVAAAVQVQSARDAEAATRHRHVEGTELQPMARRRRAPLLLLSAYTNAGAAAGTALAAVALARPALFALPFNVALAGAVWRWADGSSGGSTARVRGLQSYAGLCLLLLYVWQAALRYLPSLSPVADLLGLFAPAVDQPWSELAPEVVQLAALVVLFASLGFQAIQQRQAGARGGTGAGGSSAALDTEDEGAEAEGRGLTLLTWVLNVSQQERQQPLLTRRWQGPYQAAPTTDAEGENVPLLSSPPSQRRHPSLQQAPPAEGPTSPSGPPPPVLAGASAQGPARLWSVLLPLACEAAVAGAEQLCQRPAAVAAGLALFSLMHPSVLGGLLLLLALSVLASPARTGACTFRQHARVLAGLLLLWQLAAYCATAVDALLPVGSAAQAIGLHDFADTGPLAWLPLLAMLAAAAAAAGLARSGGSSGGAGASSASAAVQGATGAPAMSAWALVRHAMQRLLWYAGFAAVPAVQLVVGASHYSVLHGCYLAGLLLVLTGKSLQLRPPLRTSVLTGCGHALLRAFSSLHLAATYVSFVVRLDGMPPVLPPEWESWLEMLGLGQPGVVRSMLPLLGLLLLAALHAHLGAVMRGSAAAPTREAVGEVDHVPTWHSPTVVYASRGLAAYGPSLLGLLGYGAVLWDAPLGLLGLAYLLALAAVLALAPCRARWRLVHRAGSNVAAAAGGGTGMDRGAACWAALPPVLQSALLNSRGNGRLDADVTLTQCPAARWAPLLLLALLAAADFAAQALLPAAAMVQERLGLPQGVLDFLEHVVGLSTTAAGGAALLRRLLRPALLLAAAGLYRFGYCLGTLHRQVQAQAMGAAALERKALRSQLGLKALIKRALILHASKLVALLAFAAAMQAPGALGWALVAVVVALAPLLGAPAAGSTRLRLLLGAALAGGQALAGAWLVAQYAVLVPWIQQMLDSLSGGSARDWAAWAGLVVPPDAPGPGGAGSALVERLLRAKAALLLAVALRRRAAWWQAKLPRQVAAAGHCGAPCPLFWPPSPDYPVPQPEAHSGAGWPGSGLLSPTHLQQLPWWQSLRLASADLATRVRRATQQALRAVDWPVPAPAAAGSDGLVAARADTWLKGGPSQPALRGRPAVSGAPGGAPPPPEWAPREAAARLHRARLRQQLVVLRFAAQDWLERSWEELGLEVSMLLLLLAAFSAANAWSLLLMAFLAVGMATPEPVRRRAWAWGLVPVLALAVVGAYSVRVGAPPLPADADADQSAHELGMSDAAWLGLGGVEAPTLWLLFLAFSAAVLQTHYAAWGVCHARGQQATGDAGQVGPHTGLARSRGTSFDGIESPQLSTTLLDGQHSPSAPASEAGAEAPALEALYSAQWHGASSGGHSTLQFGSAASAASAPTAPHPREQHQQAVADSGAGGADAGAPALDNSLPPASPAGGGDDGGLGSLLWQPLEYSQRANWRWADWLRYWLFRRGPIRSPCLMLRLMLGMHYLDAVLVCVVALCTLEEDIVHAGYLALALLFFRRRVDLRTRRATAAPRRHRLLLRNSLFFYLPLYNYLVMLVTLLYQAPLEKLFNWRIDPDSEARAGAYAACSAAHLLGLYKLGRGESLLSLGYRGALADAVLWAVVRLETHMFNSETYDRRAAQRTAHCTARACVRLRGSRAGWPAACRRTVLGRRGREVRARMVAVVRQEELEGRRALEAELAAWKARQAAAAVEESRQRAARSARLGRLKAGIARRPEAFGVNPSVLDYAFLEPYRSSAPGAAGASGGSDEQGVQPEAAEGGAQEGGAAGLRRRRPGQPAVAQQEGPALRSHSVAAPAGQGELEERQRRAALAAHYSLPQPLSSSLLTDYERQMLAGEEVGEEAGASAQRGEQEPPRTDERVSGQQATGDPAGPSEAVSAAGPSQFPPSPLSTPRSPALLPPAAELPDLLPSAPHASARGGGDGGPTPPGGPWQWLRRRLWRGDRESYVAYVLFLGAFLADCSLLLAALPVSLFLYALVSISPSRRYWQAALVYSESIIICQYAYLVPAKLGLEVLGIHSNPARSTPIFLVYLATLFHTYSLATRAAAAAAAATAAGEGRDGISVVVLAGGGEEGEGAAAAEERRCAGAPQQHLGEAVSSAVATWLRRTGAGAVQAAAALGEFLLRTCTVTERPPHYLLVRLQRRRAPPGAQGAAAEEGVALQERLQGVLDAYRAADIAAARERLERQATATLGYSASSEGLELDEGARTSQDQGFPLIFERGRGEAAGAPPPTPAPAAPPPTPSPLVGGAVGGAGGGGGGGGVRRGWQLPPPEQEQEALALAQPVGGTCAEPAPGGVDLSTMGPLQLRFHAFLPVTAALAASSSQQAAGAAAKAEAEGEVLTLLLEVVALRSSPTNSPGWCTSEGLPLCCLNPAAAAAASLLRYQKDEAAASAAGRGQRGGAGAGGAGSARGGAAGPADAVHVVDVEPQSRQPQDWYALTVLFDFLAFVYVALFYNHVVTSARSISEITNEHVVPLGYLLTLILLFLLLVLDRLVYTLGSPAGKAALHVGQLALYFWYCLSLFWSPMASAAARAHLRVLLLLKSPAFALSALQLRTGYPPPASYGNGMGRHTFVFMRQVSTLSAICFQVFMALPFLYELRQLLDWACTPTTLSLMDWMKLEDINISLYFVTWDSKVGQEGRTGALLFVGLLLLLWAPLLVFSSGNPTYTVARVVGFSANATLAGVGTASGGGGAAGGQAFLLYSAGDRRQQQEWVWADAGDPGAPGLPAALGSYAPEQLQLLCVSPDADAYWHLTPPARLALADLLSHEAPLALSFGWSVERDAPPPSDHGGPLCSSGSTVPLADASRRALLYALAAGGGTAPLLRNISAGAPSGGGGGAGQGPSEGLYPLLWLLRGDRCTGSPLTATDVGGGRLPGGGGGGGSLDWADQWVACNATLLVEGEDSTGTAYLAAAGEGGAAVLHAHSEASAASFAGVRVQGAHRQQGGAPAARGLLAPSGRSSWGAAGSGAAGLPPTRPPHRRNLQLAAASHGGLWWRMECATVDGNGTLASTARQLPSLGAGDGTACGTAYSGPRVVAVLERVQGGLIGQTLSKLGIAGLYSVFVYAIGRFLRLSMTNIRTRIPFENLPSTRRLVALCQDIYIARAEGELMLEEELFWALITIYRLPSVMFELTRRAA